MYWQVYLHKTTVSTERMLVNLMKRAQALVRAGEPLVASDALIPFLQKDYVLADFSDDPGILKCYGQLDDNDIWGAIKFWRNSDDTILSILATMIIERKLFQIRLSAEPIKKNQVETIQLAIIKKYKLLRAEAKYLFSHGTVTNEAYAEGQEINVLMKTGEVLDIAQASDLPNIKAISKIVKKNYLCWPKNVSL
jgi:HD superfamily phosphohydrolase